MRDHQYVPNFESRKGHRSTCKHACILYGCGARSVSVGEQTVVKSEGLAKAFGLTEQVITFTMVIYGYIM
jgi:hypothetical protein